MFVVTCRLEPPSSVFGALCVLYYIFFGWDWFRQVGVTKWILLLLLLEASPL